MNYKELKDSCLNALQCLKNDDVEQAISILEEALKDPKESRLSLEEKTFLENFFRL